MTRSIKGDQYPGPANSAKLKSLTDSNFNFFSSALILFVAFLFQIAIRIIWIKTNIPAIIEDKRMKMSALSPVLFFI